MDPASCRPVSPPYRCEFAPSETEAIAACNREHGFAVVRGVLADTRTYYAAFPHGGTEARLSRSFILRPTAPPFRAPWALTESARPFRAALPSRLHPLVQEYTGLDKDWKLAE